MGYFILSYRSNGTRTYSCSFQEGFSGGPGFINRFIATGKMAHRHVTRWRESPAFFVRALAIFNLYGGVVYAEARVKQGLDFLHDRIVLHVIRDADMSG